MLWFIKFAILVSCIKLLNTSVQENAVACSVDSREPRQGKQPGRIEADNNVKITFTGLFTA